MRVVYPTFPDEVLHAEYPFEAGSSRSNGTKTIDTDVFLDGRIFPPDGRADVYLSQITIGATVELVLSNSTGEVGRASYPRSTPPDFVLFVKDDLTDVGLLRSHPAAGLARLSSWTEGVYRFTASQTRFAASVVIPQPQPCVRVIELDSGALFFDTVTLIGEGGVQLTVPAQSGSSSSSIPVADIGRIRVDIVGDPLFARRLCEATSQPLRKSLVTTIVFDGHEITPPPSGGFMLSLATSSADDQPALRILPETNGLLLTFLNR